MKARMTASRFFLAATLALLAGIAGTSAHAFELETLDAVRTNIDDHVGGARWSLIQLWTTDCVPCEQQKPMLKEFHADHADIDARVIGIALDGPKAIDEILAIDVRHGSPYETLVAFDDVFAEQFQDLTGQAFRATPTYLLFDRDGRFAGVHIGKVAREALEGIVAR